MKLTKFLKGLRLAYRGKYRKFGYNKLNSVDDELSKQFRIDLLMILDILKFKIFDFFNNYDAFIGGLRALRN